MLFVIIDKGRQQVVSRFFAVQICFKQSQPTDVQLCLPHFPGQGKLLSVFRVEIIRLRNANPPALPRLCALGSFKTADILCHFSGIRGDGHPAEITGIRRKGHIQLHAQPGKLCPFTAKQECAKVLLLRHFHAGVPLLFSAGIFNLPGYRDRIKTVSHRVIHSVDFQCIQFHFGPRFQFFSAAAEYCRRSVEHPPGSSYRFPDRQAGNPDLVLSRA